MPEKQNLSTFVVSIDLQLGPKILEDLKKQGFEITHPPHTLFSAKKKGVSCTLYESGKLTVQGKEMRPFIEFYLEPEILKNFSFTYAETVLDITPRIGSDEAGKGDFFGSLCIAAVYCPSEDIPRLQQIGVRDSKTLSDQKIAKLAQEIQKMCPHQIVRIGPEKYNEMYQTFGNLNTLLAWGHATAIEALTKKTGCTKVIVDKFADERVLLRALESKKVILELTQKTQGESDVIVAAASILARAAFVAHLAKLSQEAGMELPKGASQKVIDAGRRFVMQFGREALRNVAKLHFKTTYDILS